MNKKLSFRQSSGHALCAIVILVLSLLGGISGAQAALQFSDGFDYPAGALDGNGPPPGGPAGQTGWTNINGNAQITAPGLVFTGDSSAGNKATIAGAAGTNGDIVAVGISQVVGGTKWVAFLISKASGPASPGGSAVVGLGGFNGIGMLFDENIYGIDTTTSGGPVTRARTSTAVSATTVLLVTKLDFTTGMEYIFVNPASGSTPVNAQADASVAMGSDFQANGFNQIVLAEGFNTASFNFDELRIGDSFAEVVPEPSPATFGNISTRATVQAGTNVLIGGFIVAGTAPKDVIVRGIGPSLTAFGVAGALADPTIELHEPGGVVMTNDNWKDTQESAITATGLAPGNDLESAIVATLDPGLYTVILSSADGGTGVGLVEAYDLNRTAASQLANISTRGLIQTGDNVMIGGFIVVGDADSKARTIVVRGIGPSLTAFGVAGALQNPTLELNDSDGNLLASNDDWMDGPDMQTLVDTGLAPTDAKESAILALLAPGAYTAVLSGANGTSGVGLVEAYNIP